MIENRIGKNGIAISQLTELNGNDAIQSRRPDWKGKWIVWYGRIIIAVCDTEDEAREFGNKVVAI